MSWLLAFGGFALLIILHEAGHFTAAKAVGMRVERFSLFFGRHLVSFRHGETEYGVGWIPAGVLVMRDGRRIAFDIRPRYDDSAGIHFMRLGFTYGERHETYGLAGAAGQSVSGMWGVTKKTLSVFAHIFETRERKQVGSVVGAY